jgi:hypothetical protein
LASKVRPKCSPNPILSNLNIKKGGAIFFIVIDKKYSNGETSSNLVTLKPTFQLKNYKSRSLL